jgi:hypothetical protein
MPIDLGCILREALTKLESDKRQIERQIAALRQALAVTLPAAMAPSGLDAALSGAVGSACLRPRGKL